jgi:hypothetical protein
MSNPSLTRIGGALAVLAQGPTWPVPVLPGPEPGERHSERDDPLFGGVAPGRHTLRE